jgi:hypothetical protein
VIEQGLFQLLSGDGAIFGMAGKQIHGVLLPKDCPLDALVYSTVSSSQPESLRGPNVLEVRRFQFDSYSKTFFGSRRLSRAVRNVLCPPDSDGNPTSLRTLLSDGSAIESTRIILDIDKPFQEGSGGYIFCALLDIEIAFVNA